MVKNEGCVSHSGYHAVIEFKPRALYTRCDNFSLVCSFPDMQNVLSPTAIPRLGLLEKIFLSHPYLHTDAMSRHSSDAGAHSRLLGQHFKQCTHPSSPSSWPQREIKKVGHNKVPRRLFPKVC